MPWYEIGNTTVLGQNPAKPLRQHCGELCGTGAVPPCHNLSVVPPYMYAFVSFTYLQYLID